MIAVLLLGGCQTAVTTNQKTITYVGNSGFLVTTGDKKILVDGIFSGFTPEYKQPAEIQELIINSQPPFDASLILQTVPDAVLFEKELDTWEIPQTLP